MSAISLERSSGPRVGARPAALLNAAVAEAGRIVLGKDRAIRLAVTCAAAGGHLLIEDIPGVGKTTLAQTLARVLGLDYQRIQFTSDLLPADILGASVYDRGRGAFEFHPGPVFSQLVLADEVNRATPRTQSALLEAMEERQVTQDGETRALPEPFFVIATQNPLRQVGTFHLPESQLDRFLMRVELGYPDAAAERALLRGRDRRVLLAGLGAVGDASLLAEVQRAVPAVHLADPLLDYVQAIITHTRHSPDVEAGLSPRAGLALTRAAQAWALLEGRDHVVPEDVQAVLVAVVAHRLRVVAHSGDDGPPPGVAEALLAEVPVP